MPVSKHAIHFLLNTENLCGPARLIETLAKHPQKGFTSDIDVSIHPCNDLEFTDGKISSLGILKLITTLLPATFK